MQNSLQKMRRINLVGVINDHDDPDEENLEIIDRLEERLDDPGGIMFPGDVFRVSLPGGRREYYIVFKNVSLIGEQQAYYQKYRYNRTPPKRLDYSGRGFHHDYDPNDINSLYDLEFEIIEDIKLDYSIELGHVLEVNIGGEEGQSPIIVYYKVVRGLLNIEPEDVKRSAKVREGFNAELEEEANSQRGGSYEGNFNRASRKYLTKIGYLTEKRPQLFLNGKQLQGIALQQRSERKHKGTNGAADLEYDAAVLEYNSAMLEDYMPLPPKSKPVIPKRGGQKKKTQKRKSKSKSKKQQRKRKTYKYKKSTK
jgi:hypothetical protein